MARGLSPIDRLGSIGQNSKHYRKTNKPTIMKKTMIPLLAVLCMLSVISCKKSADLSSNSNAVAPGFPGANMTNSFPSGITVSVPLGGNIQHA
jgi:hypothetical protein